MTFKTMDPDTIREMLKGHEDVITPAAKADHELLKLCTCPVCYSQGANPAIIPPKMVVNEDGEQTFLRLPFSGNKTNVKIHAKCKNCGTEYCQHTGVIISQKEPVITSVQL